MARILVVGATGHLGGELVKACLQQGHEAHALVRPATRTDPEKMQLLQAAGATLHEGDLKDHDSLIRACRSADIVISAVGGMQVGDEGALVAEPVQATRRDENAINVAHGSVERELTQEEERAEGLCRQPARGGQHAHGEGQIEEGALLAQVAGSQVGGDALVRPRLLGVDDGCPDPLAGFAHPCAGESDDLEIGQMLVERYLNLDRSCLHADECNGGYFCEHESRVATTTDKKWPVFDSGETGAEGNWGETRA